MKLIPFALFFSLSTLVVTANAVEIIDDIRESLIGAVITAERSLYWSRETNQGITP